jgi:hypothetical protein
MVMSRQVGAEDRVERTLRAFGGRGTLGDLILVTGLPHADVVRSLESLMATERVHVAVSESAVLTYRLPKEPCSSRPRSARSHNVAAGR